MVSMGIVLLQGPGPVSAVLLAVPLTARLGSVSRDLEAAQGSEECRVWIMEGRSCCSETRRSCAGRDFYCYCRFEDRTWLSDSVQVCLYSHVHIEVQSNPDQIRRDSRLYDTAFATTCTSAIAVEPDGVPRVQTRQTPIDLKPTGVVQSAEDLEVQPVGDSLAYADRPRRAERVKSTRRVLDITLSSNWLDQTGLSRGI